MRNNRITSDLLEEAKKNPNGWVYVLDKEYDGKEEVPPEFIQGAWKVNGNGEIEGDFMPNPKYHGNK